MPLSHQWGLRPPAGSYRNRGYGTFEFYLASFSNATTSASCKALISEIPTILPGAIDPAVPTWLIKWNSPWASHVRLAHFTGNIFNVSFLTGMPTGDANELYWTLDGTGAGAVLAEFASSGVGFTGTWGAGDGITGPQGESVRDHTEVWFEQI